MWNKDKFIKDLTEALVYETENSGLGLNIDFMISVVNQKIEECTDFVEDLKNKEYNINWYKKASDDDMSYTNGKIRVLVSKKEEQLDSYASEYENYVYWITFGFDDRDWGYCECSPEDENYDHKHRCCGMGCDFTAPSFSITKEISFGEVSWDGYERDLWAYLDRDKGEDLIEKEQKEARRLELESVIRRAKEELDTIQ